MSEEFDFQESINALWEKLAEWMNSLILGLPNFILAILVFVLFIVAAKYIAKVFLYKVRQESIREVTVKIIKVGLPGRPNYI